MSPSLKPQVGSELADVVGGRIPVDEDVGLGHFEGQSSVFRDIAGEPGKQRKHDTMMMMMTFITQGGELSFAVR